MNYGCPPIVGCILFLGPPGLNALSWSGSAGGKSGRTAAEAMTLLLGAGGANGSPKTSFGLPKVPNYVIRLAYYEKGFSCTKA